MQSVHDSRQTIRVLVADDTRVHTQLLADALRRDSHLEVITPLTHSSDLVEAVKSQKIDVVVVCSNLDDEPLRGFDVLREIRASVPGILGIMLLDSSKREVILHAFRAGARGIFSRHEPVEVLTKCIRSVYQGQIWANSQQMSFAVEALASSPVVRAVDAKGLDLLSKREMEVVRSLAQGLTNREIAERLGLSQHTIKNYLFRVFDKLGVSSRLELLFMTLTQAGAPESALPGAPENPVEGENHPRRLKPGRPGRKLPAHSVTSGTEPHLQFRVSPTVEAPHAKAEKKNEEWHQARARASAALIGTDPLD